MNKKSFEQIIEKIVEQRKDLNEVHKKTKYFLYESWPLNGSFSHLNNERSYVEGYGIPTNEELAREKEIIRKTIQNYPDFSVKDFKEKYPVEGLVYGGFLSKVKKADKKNEEGRFHRDERFYSLESDLKNFEKILLKSAEFQKNNADEIAENYKGYGFKKNKGFIFSKVKNCASRHDEDDFDFCPNCHPESLKRYLETDFLKIEKVIEYYICENKNRILAEYSIHSMKSSKLDKEELLEDLVVYVPNIADQKFRIKSKLDYEIDGNKLEIKKVNLENKEDIKDLYELLEKIKDIRHELKVKHKDEVSANIEKDLKEYRDLVYNKEFIERHLLPKWHESEEKYSLPEVRSLANQTKELQEKTSRTLADIEQRIANKESVLKKNYNILQINLSDDDVPRKGGWFSEDDYPGVVVFPEKKIEEYSNSELIEETVKYVKEKFGGN